MKSANTKPHLLNQDIRESDPCFDFGHLGYTIAEKVLTLFVSKQIFQLKSTLADQLLAAFSPDVKRIDAITCVKTILTCATKTILEASPKQLKRNQESIFEEEPDLVALLVQKSLKKFFREFKEIVLALTDKVHDFNPQQL